MSDLNDLSWKNVGVIIFINLFLCYQVPSLLYTYWNLITVDILIYSLNYHHFRAQLLSPWSNFSNSILSIYLPVALTKAMHLKLSSQTTYSDSLLKKKHHGGVFALYARRNSCSSLCFQGSFSTSCWNKATARLTGCNLLSVFTVFHDRPTWQFQTNWWGSFVAAGRLMCKWTNNFFYS